MPERVPSLVVGGSEDEPLILAGPPRELAGRIELHNPGSAKVVLRDAGLKDRSGALRLPEKRHALAPVVLRPDEGESVPLALAVDPATPPGEYEAELDVGGRTRPVVLHVEEVFDLTVVPRSLVVANRTGVEQTKRLVITNDGNVAFTFGDPGIVELRDDLRRDRLLRVAVEELVDRKHADLESLVVALLAVARDETPVGSVEVRLPGGEIAVRPGETKVAELELVVRDELPPHRRYRGRLPVLTRDVDVVVVASGGPARDDVPQPPRRKATETKPPPRKATETKPPAAQRKKPSRKRGAAS